jgi:hypothetical protein
VLSTANRLVERLSDPAFAERTRALSGKVAISDEETPQAVTIELSGSEIRLRCGTAAPEKPGPGLEEWLAQLRGPAEDPWQAAAERFWAALQSVPGAPPAMVAVDTDSGDRLRLGAASGPAVEVHAPPQALAALFGAETTLIEGAFDGSVRMRGGFPDLSLFAAAAYRLRYGDPAAGPGEGAG